MIEDHLKELTAAVRALTDAIAGYPAPSAPVEAEPPAEKQTPKKEKPSITVEQVSAATRDFCMQHSIGAAGEILASFGVKSVKQLKESDYAGYMAKLDSYEAED